MEYCSGGSIEGIYKSTPAYGLRRTHDRTACSHRLCAGVWGVYHPSFAKAVSGRGDCRRAPGRAHSAEPHSAEHLFVSGGQLTCRGVAGLRCRRWRRCRVCSTCTRSTSFTATSRAATCSSATMAASSWVRSRRHSLPRSAVSIASLRLTRSDATTQRGERWRSSQRTLVFQATCQRP